MSIINKTSIAYYNKICINISDECLKGKWSVIFFYPANFIFVCPTELLYLSENYSILKNIGLMIHTLHIKHGMYYIILFLNFNIQ